ncbi:PD-(D/E)XK motif protein [uncultured Pseudokineococcus sp.]|uniref:PD-(D/E)XK motif protein n=1 Tax=uncultured Pseudokineococcus sp. TaxID=1642928 RepID=UPI0026025C03|nr:PD-(D/E)XK motif protein [uncultured Pseudokineococcus sp.]
MGTTHPAASRHLGVEVLTGNHDAGVPGIFAVTGIPEGRVGIQPAHRRLSLSIRATGNPPEPDLGGLAHLDYAVDHHDGQVWQRLDVTYADNLPEVYGVLCAVLDRVQVDGEDFTSAVQSVLTGLGDILAGTGALSRDRQVGLLGELATLLAVADATGTLAALTAWRGPHREEHDFGLADLDLEVKTTTAETRAHWIAGPTQLLPTPGRALMLLSIQITAAGAGPGATLTDLVAAARAAAGTHASLLETGLREAGWHDRHADLYRDRWLLRSAPTFHLVDDVFPALTPAGLTAATTAADRIVDLRYRIDVTGLPAAVPPFPFTSSTGALP